MGSLAITNQYGLQLNAHLHTSFHPSPDGRSDRIRIGHSILMRFIKVQNSVSWIAMPMTSFHMLQCLLMTKSENILFV